MAKSETNSKLPPANDYRCRYCFLQFDNRKLLRSHVNHHVKNDHLHSCYFCGLRIRRKDNYDTHLRQHIGELHYPCEFCGRYFMNIGNYSRHTCEILNCQSCGKYFNVGRRLEKHIATVHSAATKKYPVNCTLCRMGFLDLVQYERHTTGVDHIKKAEQLNNVKVCINGMDFQNPTRKFHQLPGKGLTTSKVARCEVCRKQFPTLNCLNDHLASREHKLQALKVRIKKVKVKLQRVNGTTDDNANFGPIQAHDQILFCNLCDKNFVSKRSLKYHVYTQHTAKESRKRWCQPCQVFISCESKFRRHLLSMSHKLRSQDAPMSTSNGIFSNASPGQPETLRPSRGNHNFGKNYFCTICGKRFNSGSSLRCHKSRKHRKGTSDIHSPPDSYNRVLDKDPLALDEEIGEEPSSATWNILKVPPIKIKLRQVPKKRQRIAGTHVCPICKKSYVDKHALKHHMPVHTRQWECKTCGKCVRDEYDLNKHVRTHYKRSLDSEDVLNN